MPSWFFECSKNISSTLGGKIKRRPTGMAGDSAGKCERDGKGGCVERESERVAVAETRLGMPVFGN